MSKALPHGWEDFLDFCFTTILDYTDEQISDKIKWLSENPTSSAYKEVQDLYDVYEDICEREEGVISEEATVEFLDVPKRFNYAMFVSPDLWDEATRVFRMDVLHNLKDIKRQIAVYVCKAFKIDFPIDTETAPTEDYTEVARYALNFQGVNDPFTLDED